MADDNLDVKATSTSSTETKPDVKQQPTSEVDASGTSTGKTDEKQTLESVVKKAYDESKKTESSPVKEGDQAVDVKEESVEKPESQEQKSEETPETKIEEADKPDAGGKIPYTRFKEVLTERDTHKAEAQRLKPSADFGNAVGEFCQKHGLTDTELNDALEVAALLKTNPVEGKKRLAQYLEAAEVIVGERLPVDLQAKQDKLKERLDAGIIDKETFAEATESLKEVAKSRLEAKRFEIGSKRQTESAQQQQFQATMTAINGWQANMQKRDPDFKTKYPLAEARALQLISEAKGSSPSEVVAFFDKAYQEVSKLTKSSVPPQTKKTLKSDGSSTTATEKLELDADMNNLGKVVRFAASRPRSQ